MVGASLLLILPPGARGECQLSTLASGEIVLENEFVRLSISPEIGGRASSFIYKSAGGDLTMLGQKAGGLFGDRIVGQGFPCPFMTKPYKWRAVKKTSQKITVELSRQVGALLFTKRISLRSGCTSIQFDRTLAYIAADSKVPERRVGMWCHQSMRAGTIEGQRAWKNTFFVPTTEGGFQVIE